MPHFQNQHEDRSPKGVFLTDEQFNKLVELLTPGHDLAKLYIAQIAAMPVEPPPPPSDAGTE
jgi:hypothetical protein